MTDKQQPATEFQEDLVQGSTKGAMKDAGAKSRDLWQVPPEKIRVLDGFNVRERNDAYTAKVRAIADSIKAEGFKQNKPLAGIVVKDDLDDVIYVYDGHRRFEAVQLAIAEGTPIQAVPVIITPNMTIEDLTCELVQSNDGEPLQPIEKAAVCKRLLGYGWNKPQIGKRLGMTSQYVDTLLTLLSAPKAVRDMVSKGEVSAAVATATVRKKGAKAVETLTKAKAKAKAAGKDKITPKHLDMTFEDLARQHAVELGNLVRDLKCDPAYRTLEAERILAIETLVDKLNPDDGAL